MDTCAIYLKPRGIGASDSNHRREDEEVTDASNRGKPAILDALTRSGEAGK